MDETPVSTDLRPDQPNRHDELAEALLATTRALMAMAIRTVGQGPGSLTVVQHRVLLLMEEAGTLSVNRVAERLGVDQSNASRHCSRLVTLGLVRRTPAEHDRRAVDLSLTDEGRRQVHAVRKARREWADQVLARIPEHEAQAVVRGLTLLADAANDVEGMP